MSHISDSSKILFVFFRGKTKIQHTDADINTDVTVQVLYDVRNVEDCSKIHHCCSEFLCTTIGSCH